MSSKQVITAIIRDKKGRPLSIGKNSYSKTHVYMYRLGQESNTPHKICLHAEVDAILKCSNLDRADSISVYRYGKDGRPLLAKPCPICQLAIQKAGINKIFYTDGT